MNRPPRQMRRRGSPGLSKTSRTRLPRTACRGWIPPPTWPDSADLASRPVSTPSLGNPGLTIADLLRFDATALWVSQQWPRVTATQLDLGRFGMRVPVVTGTDAADIAGTLTYYFNDQQRVDPDHTLWFHRRL